MTEITLAEQKIREASKLADSLSAAEVNLELGYAKLAYLLKDISENRYWQPTYANFGEFLTAISTKYNLGRSQLYAYTATARDLGGQVSEDQLNEIGISKAMVLRKVANSVGLLESGMIEAARNPKVTVKELRKLFYDAKVLPDPEDGFWLEVDFSCYYTEEEKATVVDAIVVARKLDPPIDETMKESVQRKEIMLRFAREFLGTYAGTSDS